MDKLSGLDDARAIVLVLPWSPDHPAGVSVVVRNLAREFATQGRRVLVAVDDWGHRTPTRDASGNILYRFGCLGGTGPVALAKAVLTAPLSLLETHRLLRAERVMAVNFHYPGISALGVAMLKHLGLYRGKLAVSFHGTDVRSPSNSVARLAWRVIFGACDSISACSGALAVRVASTFSLERDRIAVIYNGVDTAVFTPQASDRNSATLPARYVVSVGSYVPLKRHHMLLHTFGRVAKQFPDLSLVIIGMEGPEREPLLLLARELGIGERLHCLVGLPPDAVAAVVAGAEICVQPSKEEAFGIAVIEAGACGVPIIASRVGGHAELLRDGVTGYLFPVDDEQACAGVLSAALRDPIAAQAVGTRFREEVVTQYTWRATAMGYGHLLS